MGHKCCTFKCVFIYYMINVLPYYDRIMKTSCYDYCIINYHLMKLVITRDISFMYTIHIQLHLYIITCTM